MTFLGWPVTLSEGCWWPPTFEDKKVTAWITTYPLSSPSIPTNLGAFWGGKVRSLPTHNQPTGANQRKPAGNMTWLIEMPGTCLSSIFWAGKKNSKNQTKKNPIKTAGAPFGFQVGMLNFKKNTGEHLPQMFLGFQFSLFPPFPIVFQSKRSQNHLDVF